jgi:hypothetical protein
MEALLIEIDGADALAARLRKLGPAELAAEGVLEVVTEILKSTLTLREVVCPEGGLELPARTR